VRVSRSGTADPILRSSKLPGLVLASAAATEQLFVHLANPAIRPGEAGAESAHPVLQRGDVGQGGWGALDLR